MSPSERARITKIEAICQLTTQFDLHQRLVDRQHFRDRFGAIVAKKIHCKSKATHEQNVLTSLNIPDKSMLVKVSFNLSDAQISMLPASVKKTIYGIARLVTKQQ